MYPTLHLKVRNKHNVLVGIISEVIYLTGETPGRCESGIHLQLGGIVLFCVATSVEDENKTIREKREMPNQYSEGLYSLTAITRVGAINRPGNQFVRNKMSSNDRCIVVVERWLSIGDTLVPISINPFFKSVQLISNWTPFSTSFNNEIVMIHKKIIQIEL